MAECIFLFLFILSFHFCFVHFALISPEVFSQLELCLLDLPTVILVCMLSLSTNTLLRMTANRATRMYVRLMSNTMDVPETHTKLHVGK